MDSIQVEEDLAKPRETNKETIVKNENDFASLAGKPDKQTRMMEREEGGAIRDREVALERSSQLSQDRANNKHRTRYLIIFTISMLISLTGLVLILVWIFRLRPQRGVSFKTSAQLMNLHPILMYPFMSSLNMYSVLVYRTHYCDDRPRGYLKILHSIIMAACLISGILGVMCIYYAHAMRNGSDWYSLHSWIGTFTLSLFGCQFLAGFVVFLKPGLGSSQRRKLMPWHRFLGIALLVLASVSVVTGIGEWAIFTGGDDYKRFKPITFVANFAGVCVVLSTLGLGYLLTEPAFKRPTATDSNSQELN